MSCRNEIVARAMAAKAGGAVMIEACAVPEAGLTVLEADCLRIVCAIERERGAPPALNELEKIFGPAATVRVARAVRGLERRGLVRIVPSIVEATKVGRPAPAQRGRS